MASEDLTPPCPALLSWWHYLPIRVTYNSELRLHFNLCMFLLSLYLIPSLPAGHGYPATASRKSSWGTPTANHPVPGRSILLHSTRVVCTAARPGLTGTLTVKEHESWLRWTAVFPCVVLALSVLILYRQHQPQGLSVLVQLGRCPNTAAQQKPEPEPAAQCMVTLLYPSG